MGIVEVRHGDGLYVRPYTFEPILETLSYGMRFDATTLAELAQIRVLLERAAIEDAVEQISRENLDRLEELTELWKQKAKAGEPAPGIDEEFHRTLYGALNNQTFMKLFEVFWIAFENLMGKGLVFQAKTPARVWDSSHRIHSMGFLEG